jgi:hypothetical protein
MGIIVDGLTQSMTEEEKKLFQLYGKLPAKKSNPLARMQVCPAIRCRSPDHRLVKSLTALVLYEQERKYFDSGDYAMSKAGKSSESNVTVGTAIPKPDRYVLTSCR